MFTAITAARAPLCERMAAPVHARCSAAAEYRQMSAECRRRNSPSPDNSAPENHVVFSCNACQFSAAPLALFAGFGKSGRKNDGAARCPWRRMRSAKRERLRREWPALRNRRPPGSSSIAPRHCSSVNHGALRDSSDKARPCIAASSRFMQHGSRPASPELPKRQPARSSAAAKAGPGASALPASTLLNPRRAPCAAFSDDSSQVPGLMLFSSRNCLSPFSRPCSGSRNCA